MLVGLSGFEDPNVTSLGFLKYSCMPPILKQSIPDPPTPPPVKPVNPTDPTSEEPVNPTDPTSEEPENPTDPTSEEPVNPTDPTSEEPEKQENTGQNDEQSKIQLNASVSASLSTLGLILLIVIPTFAVACVVSVVLILRKRSEKVTKTPNSAQTSGTPTLVNPPSGVPLYPNLDPNHTLKLSERRALL
jgi:hypothetical protein